MSGHRPWSELREQFTAKHVVVEPRSARGRALKLFKAPRWTIACGNCPATFVERLPWVDNPTLRCPECGAFNRLPLTITNALADDS